MKMDVKKIGTLLASIAVVQGCSGDDDSKLAATINQDILDKNNITESEADLLNVLIQNDVKTISADGSFDIAIFAMPEVSEKARKAGFSTQLVGPTDSADEFKISIHKYVPTLTMEQTLNIDVDQVLQEEDLSQMVVHRT